ncbi:MAG: hypothetical protein MJ252_20790, partial [archaeon]|nr:hypothetical protein [archaeon]
IHKFINKTMSNNFNIYFTESQESTANIFDDAISFITNETTKLGKNTEPISDFEKREIDNILNGIEFKEEDLQKYSVCFDFINKYSN